MNKYILLICTIVFASSVFAKPSCIDATRNSLTTVNAISSYYSNGAVTYALATFQNRQLRKNLNEVKKACSEKSELEKFCDDMPGQLISISNSLEGAVVAEMSEIKQLKYQYVMLQLEVHKFCE